MVCKEKSDVTGSIASVKGKEIEKIATSNIEQALQGKVAGFTRDAGIGQSGSRCGYQNQGNRDTQQCQSLYVIDGMITYDASLCKPTGCRKH